MEPGPTASAFAKLLDSLDEDRDRAGDKYEVLRRSLIKFFEWRGAPFPDDYTDEALNRVARKLDEGIEIKNLGGYCYQVARLIYLESLKGHDSRRTALESIHLNGDIVDTTGAAIEKELRLSCLDDCLRALPGESRELIVEYYKDEKRPTSGRRKALAERLGLRRDALANRAQRVRDKLEQCVMICLRDKRAI